MVCSVSAVAAQESLAVRPTDGLCFRCRPYPECRAFFVTNSGAYFQFDARPGANPMRAIADWGAMVNLSPRNAIGGSWFLTVGENEVSTGPVLRWRRWLGPKQSIDVAIGTPVAGGNVLRPGSVLGLVKYNPAHWIGIAARPERVRYENEYVCDDAGCRPVSGTRARFSLGVEAGEVPGFVLGATAGVVAGVVLLVIISSLGS